MKFQGNVPVIIFSFFVVKNSNSFVSENPVDYYLTSIDFDKMYRYSAADVSAVGHKLNFLLLQKKIQL